MLLNVINRDTQSQVQPQHIDEVQDIQSYLSFLPET